MSNQRKKVLILVDWYLPGYKAGGPIQSIANLVGSLREAIDFSLITFNTDLGDSKPYPRVKFNEWTKAPDGTRIFYFSKEHFGFRSLKQLLMTETYDVLYLNSMFSTRFTLMPLLIVMLFRTKTKVVLAPRGMLGPESLRIKSGKKKVFLLATRLTNFFRNVIWHASTAIEEEEVKTNFGRTVNIRTAFNLPARRQLILTEREKIPTEARFVYMARISPVKNLPAVINAMNKLPSEFKVTFDIYGSNEDQACWADCEPLIKAAPAHVRMTYKGGIQHSEVIETLQKYHFGILYTKNENFGHTIIENLSVGLPVVISDRTPWNNLEEKKVGWNVPITKEEFLLSTIESACLMDQQTYNQWSRSAFEFASKVINNSKALEANIALFD